MFRNPVEVVGDAQREAVAPGAHQQRPQPLQRDPGRDHRKEARRHMVAHAQLPADIDLAQPPGDKRHGRADHDDLPGEARLAGRLEPQAEGQRRRVDARLEDD